MELIPSFAPVSVNFFLFDAAVTTFLVHGEQMLADMAYALFGTLNIIGVPNYASAGFQVCTCMYPVPCAPCPVPRASPQHTHTHLSLPLIGVPGHHC